MYFEECLPQFYSVRTTVSLIDGDFEWLEAISVDSVKISSNSKWVWTILTNPRLIL